MQLQYAIAYLRKKGLLISSNCEETENFLSLVDKRFEFMKACSVINNETSGNAFGIDYEE